MERRGRRGSSPTMEHETLPGLYREAPATHREALAITGGFGENSFITCLKMEPKERNFQVGTSVP